MIKIYWCHRRDTNQSEPCLNPSSQNLSIRRFNKGQLYDLSRLRGTALEAETLQWSWQQKHGCGVFPNNFRPLCQCRHLQNVDNLQVGVFHSMSKVWQQHICRQMKFNCCYHSKILLAATTGRHSAAAGVTANTRSASFSTGIPKWRDLFKSRLWRVSTHQRLTNDSSGCRKAPSLMWRPLSAIWVTWCALVGGVRLVVALRDTSLAFRNAQRRFINFWKSLRNWDLPQDLTQCASSTTT